MITQVSQVPAALCPPPPAPDPCMLCLGVLVNMSDRWSSGMQAARALIRRTFVSILLVAADGQRWWLQAGKTERSGQRLELSWLRLAIQVLICLRMLMEC